MTLRGLLDACYALMVAEGESGGAARGDAVAALEAVLAEPLPDEVAEEELARRRQAAMVRENEGAIARLAGLAGLERGRAVPRGV